ncbi:hypothetical protein [Primorskyibacter sp. S187A]|uniref:hypothetical protein n=1 Tax=Primorskyibacter sp. S187A TaxID=3415130 RepID=UPI003C7EAFC5
MLLEPSPALYAFFFLQTFLFVPIIAVLAVLRFAVAGGHARLAGFVAILTAFGALFLQFGPALMGLYEGALPVIAGQITRAGLGLALPLAVSAPLLLSAVLPGRRWWGVDLLHMLALVSLLGLFIWTRVL